MTEDKASPEDIPTLTDVVADDAMARSSDATAPIDTASLIAELQTRLAASAYELTEQVLHTAIAEMEATLFEQVSKRLRQELPELIDRVLREQLGDDVGES